MLTPVQQVTNSFHATLLDPFFILSKLHGLNYQGDALVDLVRNYMEKFKEWSVDSAIHGIANRVRSGVHPLEG
ncbi:MAG: hypothetical protein CMF61_00630 [Magnetococcales bacterium]|nr:hypothetical protein [Magnetococcales bacterium]